MVAKTQSGQALIELLLGVFLMLGFFYAVFFSAELISKESVKFRFSTLPTYEGKGG